MSSLFFFLFKVLLNGEEARLNIDGGPYYKWNDFVQSLGQVPEIRLQK